MMKDKIKITALFAHPDDETMLAGGTLALLTRQGAHIDYLLATRGEGGEVGEPPVSTQEELGKVRENELLCAIQSLGGGSHRFLDYIDPLIGPEDSLYAFTDDMDGLINKLADYFESTKTAAVITHGSNGEYGHPAHTLLFHATYQAVQRIGKDSPLMYTVSAAFPEHPKPRHINQNDPADFILDITPVLGEKINAANCHKSQHALFVRRISLRLGRQVSIPEIILRIESLHRKLPYSSGSPDDSLAELLRESGCVVQDQERLTSLTRS